MNDSAGKSISKLPLARFSAYSAVACGIVALFLLCWVLRDVVLLVFGAIILAVIIRALARPLSAHTRIGEKWAVVLVILLMAATCIGVAWLFGSQVAEQVKGLGEKIPRAVEQVRTWMEGNAVGKLVVERISGMAQNAEWLGAFQKLATISIATIGHAALMLFAGIYMAANPSLYTNGFVRLFPVRHREKLRGALAGSGEALRKWLLGQVVSMVSVGILTGLGLWMVGAPLPLGLGIMAGLLEFIPVIGPILAMVPGVLVAFTEGPQIALYAAIVYVAVQQIEGNVILPLAQRWAVELPPALGLVAIVAFGLLFGFLGVLFGSPLAVVVMFLVQSLYIKRGLEKGSGKAQSSSAGDS